MAPLGGVFTVPCEVTVKKILPALRAAIAITLVKNYDVTPYRAAKLLGLTPAAVSNYLSGRRGREHLDLLLTNPKTSSMIKEIAEELLRNQRIDRVSIQLMACNVCRVAREVLGA